ncbi:MAG: fumarylacetoacetate hydrolase family protein [Chloroflexi bacterium]|nr:fumarylacetoacetate hydrolase family protein [Chloroflexota bacterium]
MKLVSFDVGQGQTHVGVVRGEQIVDLSVWLPQTGRLRGLQFDMVGLIALGEEGFNAADEALAQSEQALSAVGAVAPLDLGKLRAPIPRPRKNIICLGHNYAEHAAESLRARGEDPAKASSRYPAIFTKAPTTVIGPYDSIPFNPEVSSEIDWETELAVVVGRTGKNITREEAPAYIFGYMALNDISARDIQYRQGNQFFKGKSLDGSCPTGPWIVTGDEIRESNNLEIQTRVNGIEKQHDSTASMITDVPGIIEMVSFGMTIEPGDIIATGTPAGVGNGRTPKEFLKPGDTLESEIEKIGTLRNKVMNVSPFTFHESQDNHSVN